MTYKYAPEYRLSELYHIINHTTAVLSVTDSFEKQIKSSRFAINKFERFENMTHFVDSRDLTSLIHILQQIEQGSKILHKLYTSINQQKNLSNEQKPAQQNLVDKVAL